MESTRKSGISDMESIFDILNILFNTTCFFHVGEQVYK